MKFPEKILINRMEDYHTHYLGKTSGGNLFWAYITFTFTEKDITTSKNYAVIHSFNSDGYYISSKYHTGNNDGYLDDLLEEWIKELGDISYQDIELRLFETKIDGHTLGLIPSQTSPFIELQPSSTIAFTEPWDGEYYT